MGRDDATREQLNLPTSELPCFRHGLGDLFGRDAAGLESPALWRHRQVNLKGWGLAGWRRWLDSIDCHCTERGQTSVLPWLLLRLRTKL